MSDFVGPKLSERKDRGRTMPTEPNPFAAGVNRYKSSNGSGLADLAKLRGGYYTELEIAEWICRWAIRARNDKIIETSCGDGIFLETSGKRLKEIAPRFSEQSQIIGVENNQAEAEKASNRISV